MVALETQNRLAARPTIDTGLHPRVNREVDSAKAYQIIFPWVNEQGLIRPTEEYIEVSDGLVHGGNKIFRGWVKPHNASFAALRDATLAYLHDDPEELIYLWSCLRPNPRIVGNIGLFIDEPGMGNGSGESSQYLRARVARRIINQVKLQEIGAFTDMHEYTYRQLPGQKIAERFVDIPFDAIAARGPKIELVQRHAR